MESKLEVWALSDTILQSFATFLQGYWGGLETGDGEQQGEVGLRKRYPRSGDWETLPVKVEKAQAKAKAVEITMGKAETKIGDDMNDFN